MRRGVSLLIFVLLGAALAAATARADTGTATTTTTPPAYTPLASAPLPTRCVGAGIAVIREPKLATVALATPASALGLSDYPAATPLLTFDSATASGSTCRTGAVTLNGVSLFGGAVTATSVQATDGKGAVTGLEVVGGSVTAKAGQSVAVGSWGLLLLGAKTGRLSAPLALELLKAHATLPKGTMIYLAFGAVRQPVVKTKPAAKTTTPQAHSTQHAAKRHKRKNGTPQPLKQTPGLGLKASHYVFPIDRGASYGDTYGANRSDVYDGWHHGDDLFAPLGTPVVAVADGKLTFVGWDSLGGWRIWLTDAKGNSFYYAHLSGYSRWILHHRRVKAGEVLGFLGRTGDAFTTTPHLHFEVHPHELLKLGYDGAVDPTSYLHEWRVEKLPAAEIPQPARLRAPKGTPTQEAAVVWKQLMSARHLLPNGEPAVAFASVTRRPFPASQELSAQVAAHSRRIAAASTVSDVMPINEGPWPPLVLALTLAASLFGALYSVRRRRRRPSRTPLH